MPRWSISVDSQTKYWSAVRCHWVEVRHVARKALPSQMENTVLVLPQSMARSMSVLGQKNTSAAAMARGPLPVIRIRLPFSSMVSNSPVISSRAVRAVMVSPSRAAWRSQSARMRSKPKAASLPSCVA